MILREKDGERKNRSPLFYKRKASQTKLQTKSQIKPQKKRERLFRLHPLFIAVGFFYALQGELFLFLLSALVAIQHECAHAFAAARLGYRLNKIVLMPFGAVIDGDMRASLKDEITVAIWGPLSNLITAGFFVVLWWFEPTVYAFTDTAFYSSLSIALVNLLPAYPLDGGRILQCFLARAFSLKEPREDMAERRAKTVCKAITLLLAIFLSVGFIVGCCRKNYNVSLFAFALFLLLGAFGNRDKSAIYEKMDFSMRLVLKKGAEIKRVAILESCPVKDALRFLSRGNYLVLEVYDEKETHLFDLPQNEFAELFSLASTPYTPLGELYAKNREFLVKNPQKKR